MIQRLVSNGHSWSSIKQYTLSEIGIFFRVIVEREQSERARILGDNWMSTHAEFKDLQSFLKSVNPKYIEPSKQEVSQKEVQDNWSKLAKLSKGLK